MNIYAMKELERTVRELHEVMCVLRGSPNNPNNPYNSVKLT